ncbi:MAG: site-specific DNA-methyltransferase [Methylococcaceae bacterium]|nr:site-specific DNA-methyltransferase [Methylococcaceae bacterium]MDP3903886.1 site-specific DNA-methyltransferase [Methylococcaceae bacterium]
MKENKMPNTPDVQQERLQELKRLFPDLFDGEGQLKVDDVKQLAGEPSQHKERYDFTWSGKRNAKQAAYSPTTAALTYDETRSVNPDKAGGNLIIEGENLESLKCLLAAYRGVIKCIYIDPPYNTGKDFVYSDNYNEQRQAYWQQTGGVENGIKVDTNPDSDGRYHSNWLNMIYPRLLLARQLLKDDGVIFVSIDDNEVHNLRKVMDEVFGEGNFVAQLIWEKGRKNDAKLFSSGHDYMIVYARSKAYLTENKIRWREAKPGALEIQNEFLRLKAIHHGAIDKIQIGIREFYSALPKTHPSKKLSRYSNVDDRGVWRDDNMSWPGRGGPSYDVIHPVTKCPCKVPDGGWRYSTLEKMEEMIASGHVQFREDHTQPPIRKTYLVREENDDFDDEEEQGNDSGIQVAGTYFYRSALQASTLMHNLFGAKVFESPKDHKVIGRWIGYVSNLKKDDFILDFFGGSGTTAQAVLELNKQDNGNRKFILVQLPEQTKADSEAYKAGFKKISDITIERVKRVINGVGDNPQSLEAGFKVYQLTKSHFPRVDFQADPEASEAENLQRLDTYISEKEAQLIGLFEPHEIRDEVLLKNGFRLNYRLQAQPQFTANTVSLADDGEKSALICFDNILSNKTVEQLLQTPQAFICLERALNTDAKWNLRQHLKHLFIAF